MAWLGRALGDWVVLCYVIVCVDPRDRMFTATTLMVLRPATHSVSRVSNSDLAASRHQQSWHCIAILKHSLVG